MRVQIREKTDKLAELSTSRNCWRLFRYRLILAKVNVLPRAMKFLDKIQKITGVPFHESQPSLNRLMTAVDNDLKLLQGTLEMVYPLIHSSSDGTASK
jgi:hypothetical protein